MEQRKDLRIQKTEKAIREAFLEIRRKLPLEKVKVRDICQLAMINTSTFYNHYRDVLDLSEQLENEILEKCVSNTQDIDCLFSDPYRFLAGFRQIFSDSEQSAILRILFENRHEAFHQKIDTLLRARYQTVVGTQTDDIKIFFVLGGIMHTGHLLLENDHYTLEELYRTLADLIMKLR